jgi:hypothetical protein
MRILAVVSRKSYLHSHGVAPADVGRVPWLKSTFSSMNGNCVQVSRLAADRIGVRNTKDDDRAGPVLVFTESEWSAFITGAKEGQFDRL